MRRRRDQRRVGVQMLHYHGHARRGHDVEIDHFNPARRQRGNSSQKDAYVIAQLGVSFNISSYRCPKP